MFCWQKEDETCSSHALLLSVTSPLLNYCDGPLQLSSVHRPYLPQQQQSVSDVTLEQQTGSDKYQGPRICLQNVGQQQVTDKITRQDVCAKTTNIANCRKRPNVVPVQQKDAAYYEKRRKNNESAKKSREARQHKEKVVMAHVEILKDENMRLKAEHKLLHRQSGELLARLYNRSSDNKN